MKRSPSIPGIAIAILCTAFPAVAQEDRQRGIRVAPEEDLVEQLAPKATIDRTIVLPAPPLATNARNLVGVPRIALDRVVIDNGSILTETDIAKTSEPFAGRDVAIEELEDLRRRLSLLYFDRGYVNSGLVLPDQQVVDGVVHFREVRGELTSIQLRGNDHLRDGYITKRISMSPEKPLEINELQTSLQLLEQDPMIRRMDAQLLPGAAPGQGILRLDVTESRPWQFIVRNDNHRSPAVGGVQTSLTVRNRSLFGLGDKLTLYGSYADGFGDVFASYSLPLNSHGTSVDFYGSAADSDIVEEPFRDIDIASETGTYGLTIKQAFRRSLTGAFSGFLGAEVKDNANSLLGQPFSFTAGERDGFTRVTVVYAGIEYAKRQDNSVAAVRASVRRGIYRLDATQNRMAFGIPNTGPDGQFTSFVLQGQHVYNLGWQDSVVISRLTYQYAWRPLLALERLPMGGASTVRGYRENLLVRDNGVVASVEWQVPLFDAAGSGDNWDPRRLRLALFYDYGESWNNAWQSEPDDSRQHISSAGLGLLWNPTRSLTTELYWGYAIEDLETSGDDIQDDGIHFGVTWTPWE